MVAIIDKTLRKFLKRPVLQVIGSVNEDGRCQVGRGCGVAIDCEDAQLEIVLSAWQWPETISNLRINGVMAATFMCPLDYTSYQLKGKAQLHLPRQEHLDLAERYIAETYQMLMDLGLPAAPATAFLSSRNLLVASVQIDEIIIQTPGISAGYHWTST